MDSVAGAFIVGNAPVAEIAGCDDVLLSGLQSRHPQETPKLEYQSRRIALSASGAKMGIRR